MCPLDVIINQHESIKMSDRLPTVNVIDKDSIHGFNVINESDFDEKTMKIYKGKLPAEVDDKKKSGSK